MADADDAELDDTSFIEFEGMPALSRSTFQLHSFAIINSIKDGRPGFVSDDYLNAIAAETTTAAVELEAAGMWERRDGGYFIVADEMVKMAINFNEQSNRKQDECAQRGAHLPPDESRKSGWVVCDHCGTPLERPDGGPVALPNGGPLGPDTRKEES
ncbi:hypothetical protein [Saccharopolyspora phatthalungensis]|uniref:Uncharacterized protein n=1 Tax=Saccharopolyspora phatthalungensis TaxID=664693 RepID=A0A840QBT8_9PSEU|nr:hypothetical protein [Saccharopolyspora phatthalungensis]MBB5155905.1 hypothetical protein [Saccharopolyspora phatthalungensis]